MEGLHSFDKGREERGLGLDDDKGLPLVLYLSLPEEKGADFLDDVRAGGQLLVNEGLPDLLRLLLGAGRDQYHNVVFLNFHLRHKTSQARDPKPLFWSTFLARLERILPTYYT